MSLTAEKTKAPVGTIAWFDLTTTDMQQAVDFYGKLFSWKFTEIPGCGGNIAREIVCEGNPIGTLRVAEGEISPHSGVVYVKVADIKASCKRAKELGGKIPEGFPFDLPGGGGSVALVTDGSNHAIGMYCSNPMG